MLFGSFWAFETRQPSTQVGELEPHKKKCLRNLLFLKWRKLRYTNMCPLIIRTNFDNRYLESRNSYESEVWHWLSPWQNTQTIQIMLFYRFSLSVRCCWTGCTKRGGQILCSKNHCAESNVVKGLDTVGQCTIYHILKVGTTDITEYSGKTKTEIPCRKMDERKEQFTCQRGAQQSLGVAPPVFHHFGVYNASESISGQ